MHGLIAKGSDSGTMQRFSNYGLCPPGDLHANWKLLANFWVAGRVDRQVGKEYMPAETQLLRKPDRKYPILRMAYS